MADGNYIKINRKILEWEWYSDANVCRLFLHALLKANWRDGRFRGVEVARGSFVSSIEALSRETGLTVSQVRTAIKKLNMTGEMTNHSQANFTVFTIKNYNRYQSSDKPDDRPAANESQADDKRLATIEEGKKEKRKEEKKDKTVVASGAAAFRPDSFEMQCVNALVQSCLRQFPGAKVPKTEKELEGWCVHVERMKRLDNRSEEDIKAALEYAVTDSFWQSNIRSTKKFREKFETLAIQARGKKNPGRSAGTPKKTGFQNFEERKDVDYDAMALQRLHERLGGGTGQGKQREQ